MSFRFADLQSNDGIEVRKISGVSRCVKVVRLE